MNELTYIKKNYDMTNSYFIISYIYIVNYE